MEVGGAMNGALGLWVGEVLLTWGLGGHVSISSSFSGQWEVNDMFHQGGCMIRLRFYRDRTDNGQER